MITRITKGRVLVGKVLQQQVEVLYLGAPIITSNTRIVTLADFVLNSTQTIAAQPDVPRNLTLVMVDPNASITAGLITIVGEDIYGRVISDVWNIPTNLVSTKVTTNVYAKVTSVTTSGITGAIGAGSDQVSVGVGDVIGIPDITSAASIKHVLLGAARIASPTIATGLGKSGINVAASTYNGTKVLQAYVLRSE